MFRDPLLLRRTLSLFAVGASCALACTAKDPSPGDGDGDGDGDPTGSGTTITSGTSDTIGTTINGGDGDTTGAPPSEHCQDGVVDEDEACDIGAFVEGKGCRENCLAVEEGFICSGEDAEGKGQTCRHYAICGDGLVVFPEQCDGGATAVPGCSATCKFEDGYKCTGSPSVCTATVCGDMMVEGTETCDLGDTLPFDGCNAKCQGEPDCSTMSGMGCSSSCGDGLIIAGEECDDGNGKSGDGCSDMCKQEAGYVCTVPAVDPELPLNLPIVFRDFSVAHPDFQEPDELGADTRPCDGYSPGIPTATLDAAGKPVFASAPAKSCVSAAGFAQWYTETDESDTVLGGVTLYPNGVGGYVNRFGPNGEPYLAAVKVDGQNEEEAGTTLAACEASCEMRAMNGQVPFTTGLRCDDLCRQDVQDLQQLEDNALVQAQNALTQAENADPVDEALVLDRQAAMDAVLLDIANQEVVVATCQNDCQSEMDERIASCEPQCAPCSNGSGNYCFGGELLELDGNPLFFPVDDDSQTRSPNSERSAARIPAQVYMGLGWPWENRNCDGGEVCTSPLHNFAFTSEIAYWFEYTADTVADLTFLGDDDVFVYINRKLVLDIGGIHVPLGGQLTLGAGGVVRTRIWQAEDPGDDPVDEIAEINKVMTAADLGLEAGKVYEIKVFHAERKPEGSSFQLTLAGFTASRSNCEATCGDGIIAGGEQCDNGELNTDVADQNGCSTKCVLGPYCGDGIKQETEQCDDNDPAAPGDCSNCKIIIFK